MITEEDISLSNSLFLKKIDYLFENKNKYIKKMEEYNRENPINKICDIIDNYSGRKSKKLISDKKSIKDKISVGSRNLTKVKNIKDKLLKKLPIKKKQ